MPKNNTSISIEEQFQRMDQHEHALEEPDMYIGGTDADEVNMWVYDETTKKMVYKRIMYVPGLYKIFDEILVNARDHTVREKTCKTIKVTINQEEGTIACYNDGNGIPVEIHKEEKMYVPEMIFGTLLTSGNYKQKGKVTGGKNGLGAKLCAIFSSWFYVEVIDHVRGKKFVQEFTDNMYKRTKPKITKVTAKKSSLYIKFLPDFKRLNMDGLTDDFVSLFKKRVYDVAACTDKKVKVYLNNEHLKVPAFSDYINMFYEEDEDMPAKPVYEESNGRWKVGIIFDPSSDYKQISYVNGICTFKGGKHVGHVVDKVVQRLIEVIKSKKSNKNLKIAPSVIKSNMMVFIDSVIEDPSFDSQTKEFLSSKVAKFGSVCELSDDFIKELSKTGIVEVVERFANFKALDALSKSDGKKVTRLRDIPKLEDAGQAGSRNAHKCRLILTEGDSASAFAIDGREVIGGDYFGVFPLRGKLLNVREATAKQLLENKEIKAIKQIMGLKQTKKYKTDKDYRSLRYGGIIILTDADVDGSHIKGLVMNFFQYFWPHLFKREGFIQSMSTPIVKAWKKTDRKKKNLKVFYTMSEYETWLKTVKSSLWLSKYYKGLGTSTPTETKQIFNDFDARLITYVWEKNGEDGKLIKMDESDDESVVDSETSVKSTTSTKSTDSIFEFEDTSNPSYQSLALAFDKNYVVKRKPWLRQYDPDCILDAKDSHVSITDFVNKDLKHFSNYDNIRSIPKMGDGLKPSQRKILNECRDMNLYNKELKVAQIAGYVSAKQGYHHGEASLMGAIIGMAQDFVGSNNMNVLMPNGMFGSRKMGGKDAASPRYIFSQLSPVSPYIFRKEDDSEHILEYEEDDGNRIEPKVFAPTIPMCLVNGTKGIGTGFSTDVPCFNVLQIIGCVRSMLKKKGYTGIDVDYRGFKGKIKKKNSTSYVSKGIIEVLTANSARITELPVGTWIDNYKKFLTTIIATDLRKPRKNDLLIDYDDTKCGNNTVDITLKFIPGKLSALRKAGTLEKKLKLESSHNLTNMTMYDSNFVLKKYTSVQEIVEDYFPWRLNIYTLRKKHILKVLKNDLDLIAYKVKYIKGVIAGTIKISKNKKALTDAETDAQFKEFKFPELSTDAYAVDDKKTYSYLDIKTSKFKQEEIDKLEKEEESKTVIYETYQNTSIQDIWMGELDELEKAYKKWDYETSIESEPVKKKKAPKKNVRKRR